MDKGSRTGACVGSQGLDEGCACRRNQFAPDIRRIIGQAGEQFCRSWCRYGHDAVGAADEAAARMEGRRADLFNAQVVETPNSTDDVEDAVDSAYFMEVDLLYRDAMDLGFGSSQGAKDGEALFLYIVREGRRFDDFRNICQAAVLMVVMMACGIDQARCAMDMGSCLCVGVNMVMIVMMFVFMSVFMVVFMVMSVFMVMVMFVVVVMFVVMFVRMFMIVRMFMVMSVLMVVVLFRIKADIIIDRLDAQLIDRFTDQGVAV